MQPQAKKLLEDNETKTALRRTMVRLSGFIQGIGPQAHDARQIVVIRPH